MTARIGIDTGGTFTDVVRWSRRGLVVHKLPSTPRDPGAAVLAGIAAVRRTADEPVDVVHGTTVGLNAVLTGKLARTVFITNAGMEDLIEIGRQERAELYALAPRRAVPPVPRALRVGVACRRGPDGEVIEPLGDEALRRAARAVQRLRPEAVAIGFLHSPAEPADERRVADALRRLLPEVPITCSAELLPSFGEYERFSAAILNAATAPVVGGYTARLGQALGAGSLRLLRSNLGVMPPDEAARFPARAMFSGPAGGVLATAQVARRFGLRHAAALDMGGTSADVCLVEQNTPAQTNGTIAGLPLPLPAVPVHTVGCGGGSIAFADRGGALRVGPLSAGADPGPACYGRGTDATVTDAHVALGHLGAETLLGGAFPIDPDASVRALERLAKRLGMSTLATARGVLEVADATMARAVMVITAERAIDPAGVPLVSYGGAGGLHAASLTRRLGMPYAIVPHHPGAFSAVGLALAGDSVEATEAMRVTLDRSRLRDLIELGRGLLARAVAQLDGRGRGHVAALVRYRGQGASLRLPLRSDLERAFHQEHRRRFGFVTEAPLEVVQVVARAETVARPLPPTNSAEQAPHRRMRRPPLGGPPVPVLLRTALRSRVAGPAILEEPTATTLVPRGFSASPQPSGLVIRPTRQS